jgi:hypothetical protein
MPSVVEELAQAIFDANPSIADDLIVVIDQWDGLMRADIDKGGYDADTHPDNPELVAVFGDRRNRVDRLRNALAEIRGSA